MKTPTQIERPSPTVVLCTVCKQPSHLGCNHAVVEFKAEQKEKERQRKKAEREKANEIKVRVQDAAVENTKESGNGHCNGRSGEQKLNAVGKPFSESYDPNYKLRHRVGSGSSPISASAPQLPIRKPTAEFINNLINAGLARDLLGELKAHGATFLVEALEAELKAIRKEMGHDTDESGPAATAESEGITPR